MLSQLTILDVPLGAFIAVKVLTYGATLVAAGGVLVLLVDLRGLTDAGRRSLIGVTVACALVAAVASALLVLLQGALLMGGTLRGALDPAILGLLLQSPIGDSFAMRWVGLILILVIVISRRFATWVATVGAMMACASFAFSGHALGDPRIVLGILITVHLSCVAFWVGAFFPLLRALRAEDGAYAGALAHEFGTKAIWCVALLVGAGAGTLNLLGAGPPDTLSSPYGQMFAIKLALFLGVFALAGLNKLRLTPRLRANEPGAAKAMRTSILAEGTFILAILVTTATLTTLTSPPMGVAG